MKKEDTITAALLSNGPGFNDEDLFTSIEIDAESYYEEFVDFILSKYSSEEYEQTKNFFVDERIKGLFISGFKDGALHVISLIALLKHE